MSGDAGGSAENSQSVGDPKGSDDHIESLGDGSFSGSLINDGGSGADGESWYLFLLLNARGIDKKPDFNSYVC